MERTLKKRCVPLVGGTQGTGRLGICSLLTLVFVSIQSLWCCQKGGREVEQLTLTPTNTHLSISRWSLLERTE